MKIAYLSPLTLKLINMKNGYEVVNNFITPSFADYLKNYFTLIAEKSHSPK